MGSLKRVLVLVLAGEVVCSNLEDARERDLLVRWLVLDWSGTSDGACLRNDV